jgi:hypothetical protein
MIDLRSHAEHAVTESDRLQSKLPPEILALDGMSSPRVRHLLNNLCDFEECRYLEIGAWKGATALSASYRNPGSFTAVDNFSEFGGPASQFYANQERWREECPLRFIEATAWDLHSATVKPVNVYFYDGGHAESEQYRAFTHFHDAFADEFIAVVDDWNERHVRQATWAAIHDLKYSFNPNAHWWLHATGNADRDGWWNGVLVAVLQKPRVVA